MRDLKRAVFLLLMCAGIWSCNWLDSDKKILEKAYADVDIYILEMTGKVDTGVFNSICKKNNIDESDVYSWQDHTVIYKKGVLVSKVFATELAEKFFQNSFKTYPAPFYRFERAKNCAAKDTAKQCDNILLTANLVDDPKLQQEYLDYHATQFEKWPEVSKGFCNANFQQLLVFKNGRQLMLVISIPKGKTLDELNPLTTKDNPRVDEWNKLMSKYQEGIPGTKKGETWVFLKEVK